MSNNAGSNAHPVAALIRATMAETKNNEGRGVEFILAFYHSTEIDTATIRAGLSKSGSEFTAWVDHIITELSPEYVSLQSRIAEIKDKDARDRSDAEATEYVLAKKQEKATREAIKRALTAVLGLHTVTDIGTSRSSIPVVGVDAIRALKKGSSGISVDFILPTPDGDDTGKVRINNKVITAADAMRWGTDNLGKRKAKTTDDAGVRNPLSFDGVRNATAALAAGLSGLSVNPSDKVTDFIADGGDMEGNTLKIIGAAILLLTRDETGKPDLIEVGEVLSKALGRDVIVKEAPTAAKTKAA